MNNYYDELGLDRNLTIDELQLEISKQESVWKSRRTKAPEKATKMLALIIEAREAFSTPESKREYDLALSANDGVAEAPSTDFQEAKKLMEAVLQLQDDEQWDLAKTAIQKVLPLAETGSLTDEQKAAIFITASDVFLNNAATDAAIEYANQAAVLTPDNPLCYANKANALFKKILDLRFNAGADLLTKYRKTCELWVEKARHEGDAVVVATGLDKLAYACFMLRDYACADKYAVEAMELDPEGKYGKSVLDTLDSKREIHDDDYYHYLYQEVSPYEEDIEQLIRTLISSGLDPDTPEGWVVVAEKKKNTFEEKPVYEKTLYVKSAFILTTEGRFIEKRVTTEEYWNKRANTFEPDKVNTEIVERTTAQVMAEMDLEIYSEFRDGDRHGWSVFSNSDVHNGRIKSIFRHGFRKGKALYDFLKTIIDKEADYIAACEKVNAEFRREFEPQEQVILEKYKKLMDELAAEREQAIESAQSDEADRSRLAADVEAAQAELSGLGFFAGKRKKELQANISQLEHSLSQMPSVDDVQASYQSKAAELERQQQEEVAMLVARLREKHPLPEHK